MGRFINADAYISTGQGLLGINMFTYCINGPLNYVDDTGFIPHSLIQPEAMLYGSNNSNIIMVHIPSPKLFETGTIIIGGTASIYTGPGGGGAIGVAVDSYANVALVASGSAGAGSLSGGVGAFLTYSTAPTIKKALGRSEYAGGSICLFGISFGYDYAISNDTETGEAYHSFTFIIGGKAATPFETHGGVSYMIDVADSSQKVIAWATD